MAEPRKRAPSEIVSRGYSDDEVAHIYELGRLFLESGQLRKGEAIILGLTEVAPGFAPAWLALAYIHIQGRDFEAAIQASLHALRADTKSVEAVLFLAACYLTVGDFNSAGTYLGEVGERIESGEVDSPNAVRFYRAQLARFQSR